MAELTKKINKRNIRQALWFFVGTMLLLWLAPSSSPTLPVGSLDRLTSKRAAAKQRPDTSDLTKLYLRTVRPSTKNQKKLDQLAAFDRQVNAPVPELSFGNVTADPYVLIRTLHPDAESYRGISRLTRAREYLIKGLEETEYYFEPVPDEYDWEVYSEEFVRNRLDSWEILKSTLSKSELRKMGLDGKLAAELIYDHLQKRRNRNEAIADQIEHSIRHAKIATMLCMHDGDEVLDEEMEQVCGQIGKHVWPFVESLPKFVKYSGSLQPTEVHPFRETLFWPKMVQNQNDGYGGITWVDDGTADAVVSMIKVLRSRNEKWPLQIFHNGPLSQETIRKIVEGSTMVGAGIESSDVLDVTFVDVEPALAPKFKHMHPSSCMSVLNSIRETVLLDPLTVPLVDLQHFTLSPNYMYHRVFLFHGRQDAVRLPDAVINTVRRNVNGYFEDHYLDLFKGHGDILQSRFFKYRYSHVMTRGMTAIKHMEHMDALMMGMMLDTFHPLDSTWAEHIWLGEEFCGRDWAVNNEYAGAVGVPQEDSSGVAVGTTVCSKQIGQVADGQLLWIGPGMSDEEGKPLKIRKIAIPPHPMVRKFPSDENAPTKGWERQSENSDTWCAHEIIGGVLGQQSNYVPGGSVLNVQEGDAKKYDAWAALYTGNSE